MKTPKAILIVLLLAGLALLGIDAIRQRLHWASYTDDQLLAKVNVAVQAGSFQKQDEAMEAVSELLRRRNPEISDAEVVDCLITTGASLLTHEGEWTHVGDARQVYNTTRRYDDATVIQGLVRRVMDDQTGRLRVLFFSVKLGISGSEDRLNEVLHRHGDVKMAEDFLNAGSSKLFEGAKAWADKHGYSIGVGMGSHRVSWGHF
jgi:hypothetical protein